MNEAMVGIRIVPVGKQDDVRPERRQPFRKRAAAGLHIPEVSVPFVDLEPEEIEAAFGKAEVTAARALLVLPEGALGLLGGRIAEAVLDAVGARAQDEKADVEAGAVEAAKEDARGVEIVRMRGQDGHPPGGRPIESIQTDGTGPGEPRAHSGSSISS
jgi:hypothetical protein